MKIGHHEESPLLGRGWLAAAALSVFVVAGMFYVFPSGTPQPADFLFTLVAAFLAWPAWRLSMAQGNYAAPSLVLWAVIVNWTWFIFSGEAVFVRSAFFYLFNYLVFLIYAYAFARSGTMMARWFRGAIIAALLIQLGVLSAGDDVFRAVGTFNNPNQLGYWSILLLAAYGIVRHDQRLGFVDLGIVAIGLWTCILSLSRAAIIPAVLVCLVFLILHPARQRVKVVAATAIASVFIIVTLHTGVTTYISEMRALTGVEKRYSRIATSERSELEVRGYDRIWRFPEYVFVGAGEGTNQRFYRDGGFELHSTFGAMLFSYGIVGFVLFLLLLYQSLRSTPLLVKAYFVPVLMYGLTHQGLRFSYFWILLGIVAAIGSQYRAERAMGILEFRPEPRSHAGTP